VSAVKTRKTILVAEDNPDDVFLLKRAFSEAQVNAGVEFVEDGEDVIEYLKSGKRAAAGRQRPFPALLLLDLKMPRMDGFDVLDWVRRQPGLKRMLIVVLTSSSEPRDVNRAYDLGANSFLCKSTYEDLTGLVGKIHDYWLEMNESPDYVGTNPEASRER
jgi:CheY-like chemotaxis protein